MNYQEFVPWRLVFGVVSFANVFPYEIVVLLEFGRSFPPFLVVCVDIRYLGVRYSVNVNVWLGGHFPPSSLEHG